MTWRTKIGKWLLKSTLSDPEPWLVEWLTGKSGSNRIAVNAESVQRSSAAYSSSMVRQQDIAKLPLPLYRRRDDGGRERATDNPLYQLVRQPRPYLNSFNWREMGQACLDFRGNHYTRIVRDRRERPIELVPLMNGWVQPICASDGTPFYDVRMYGRGKVERLAYEEVLHFKERTDDGFVGKSVIARARDVFESDLAKTQHGAKLYANGVRPSGLLIPKGGTIGKEGRDLARQEFVEQFGGDNLYSIGVAGQEMRYEQVSMTSVDADFINDRKLSRAEIAALFRVPPHKVGIMDNATFSNIEHQSLEYVTDTLMPIARRWEEELNAKLLREDEKETYYFEFLFNGLLRGDFLSRMQGYAIGRQWGWLSADDVRETENMNKLPKGGDEYLVPLNMWPVGQARPEKTLDAQPPAQPGKAYEDYGRTDNVLRIPVER